MERKITGFHLDELNDWVAELECGHGQHTRHDPPFANRPWMTTVAGRRSRLGQVLNCKRCDQLEMPDDLPASDRSDVLDETALPLRAVSEQWASVHLLEGALNYKLLMPLHIELSMEAGMSGIVVPDVEFELSGAGSARFYLQFYAMSAH